MKYQLSSGLTSWLAEHAEKQVVAPGFERRQGKMSWGVKGLLPKHWIEL